MTRVRALLILLVLIGLAAAVVLGRWGTRWTVLQATSFSAGYSLEAAWDGNEIPNGKLDRPIGIAVAPSGDVYVTDARLRVVRFNAAGEFLGQWGREGEGRGEFRNPVGVAIGRDGTVYVSDYEQDRIQKFTATGEFRLAFGRSGSEPGALNAPAGLTVDEAGSLYVADFYNHRVQTWRENGSFARVIGHAGRVGPGCAPLPDRRHTERGRGSPGSRRLQLPAPVVRDQRPAPSPYRLSPVLALAAADLVQCRLLRANRCGGWGGRTHPCRR